MFVIPLSRVFRPHGRRRQPDHQYRVRRNRPENISAVLHLLPRLHDTCAVRPLMGSVIWSPTCTTRAVASNPYHKTLPMLGVAMLSMTPMPLNVASVEKPP